MFRVDYLCIMTAEFRSIFLGYSKILGDPRVFLAFFVQFVIMFYNGLSGSMTYGYQYIRNLRRLIR